MATFNNPARDNSVIANKARGEGITWDGSSPATWNSEATATWDDPFVWVNPTKDTSVVTNGTKH